MANESVIVKLRTNHDGYFKNLAKYTNFFNHLLEKNLNTIFYLESVEDGILHIFKNFEAFKIVHTPIQPRILAQIKQIPPEQNFILKGVIEPNEILPPAMESQVECISANSDDLFSYMKSFYDSFNLGIQVVKQKNFITISMNSEAFLVYANYLYANIEMYQTQVV
jgi:hypothetical protein